MKSKLPNAFWEQKNGRLADGSMGPLQRKEIGLPREPHQLVALVAMPKGFKREQGLRVPGRTLKVQ